MTDPAETPLLLVEDDRGIAEPLTRGLARHGYPVTWAADATAAQTAAAQGPDVVLLDLGLPDLDGVALCRRLRELLPHALIIILTARDAEVDVVVGLEAGADDYLVKPFGFSALLARLRAHLRRQASLTRQLAGSPEQMAKPVIRMAGLTLDPGARRCTIRGAEVDLRPKEFDLLAVLLERAGHAVPREELMRLVWDEHWYGSTKTLDMHIAMLRRRLVGAGADPTRITTLRGYGYRFESDPVR